MVRAILLLSLFFTSPRLLAQTPTKATGIDGLQRLFQKPPDDSRIMMRWWWFGPAVTRPEIERELRFMKEGGIGGFEVQPVYPVALDDAKAGIRNLPFLSDEFIDALRFTSEKARELGLRMDLTLGSGWPFGGPQVPIAQAAARLRVERVKLADEIVRKIADETVRKLAEGTRRVPLPAIAEGEALLAVFLARAPDPSTAAFAVREITDIRDGSVRVPADLQGPHEVQFFIESRTGMQVKRPALGGEGFVLDHYDRGAIDRYLKNVGDRLMQAFGESPPYSIFCDSLEVYGGDWTPGFLEEFRKRRGYDLRPHLPALAVDLGPETAAIRHDWGQTLTELLNERFLAPIKEWSVRNRTLFRIQGYGIPPATLSSNALADLPEGEGYQWKTLRASRWASSASHLYGRPVTSSETWTWLHSPSFRATPLDVKAEADLHFLQGVNQLIGHGWPYTAEGVEYPGWRFYASGVFNEKNPWWIAMPDLSRYLQRLSFLLRQGQPANDVALYLPNDDAWAHFTAGTGNVHLIQVLGERLGPDIVARILESGFNLDFVDDDAIARLGRVEKGSLVLGGNKYRAVILPGVDRMPLATLRTLEEFARSGGALVATRRVPATPPGFRAAEADANELRAISERLFRGPSAAGHFVEDENKDLARTLTGLLRPDMALSPPVPEIGFVHRRTGDAEIYFLANTSNERQRVKATFRVERLRAEWWDPMSGRLAPAEAQPAPGGGMAVALELPPYGSRVLVFAKRRLPDPGAPTTRAIPSPLDVSAGWRVAFGAGGKPVSMDRLRSWTEDDETRFFSGVATYEKEVVVPASLLRDGLSVRLELGEGQAIPSSGPRARMQAWLEAPVREAAVIFVNGRRAGSVWCPPYSLDVTGLLRPGENQIKIEVGNLAVNHMAGRALPDYKLLNLRHGVRFEPQDMDKVQPVAAGLLGPIRLVASPGTR